MCVHHVQELTLCLVVFHAVHVFYIYIYVCVLCGCVVLCVLLARASFVQTFETDGEYGGGFDGRMSPGVEMPYHSLRGVTVMRNSFSTGDLHSLALSSHAGSTRGLLLDDAGLYKNGETPPPPPAKKEHYGGGQRTPASYQNTGSGGSPATASGAVLDRIDEVDDSQDFDRNAAKAMPSGPLGASSQWRQEAEDARRKELIQQDAVQQMLRQQQQQQHQHQQHGHEQQRGADADQSLDNSMNSFDISLAQMEANLLMNANSTKIRGTGSRGYFGGYMMPQQQHQQQQPLSPQQAPQYRHRPAFDVHGGGESVNPLLYGRGPVLPPPQGHYGAEHDTMQRRSALGNMGTAMPGISGSFGGGGGMRRALSTGDLSQLNGSSPKHRLSLSLSLIVCVCVCMCVCVWFHLAYVPVCVGEKERRRTAFLTFEWLRVSIHVHVCPCVYDVERGRSEW